MKQRIIEIYQSDSIDYNAEELKKALRGLRDYIAFDLSAYLDDEITAKQLAGKLFVLDYLVRSTDIKDKEVVL